MFIISTARSSITRSVLRKIYQDYWRDSKTVVRLEPLKASMRPRMARVQQHVEISA